jgi:hypothetical protein
MRHVLSFAGVIAVALAVACAALADGKGPHAGQFSAMCADGQSYAALVSPSDGAHVGQVTGLNVNIVSLQITITDTATGEILFQSKPTAANNPQAQNCIIDGGDITLYLWAIVTPRASR